jgi:hypothetical protein
MLQRWAKNLGAVVALLLVCGLALVVFMVGANSLQSFLVTIYKDADFTTLHPVQTTFTVRTIMNFYYVISGILFLGFFVLMDYLLITVGVAKKLVLRRTLLSLGIELLILTLFHLAMMFIQPAAPVQIALTTVEALLGIGMILVSRRKGNILPWVKETK